jgi:predicted anti-sigma-YlaC factor YlaD
VTPPEVRRLVRMVGTVLASTSLVVACAVAAQTAAYQPGQAGGLLPWVFALFVGAALVGIFMLVLLLVRDSPRHPGGGPPGPHIG